MYIISDKLYDAVAEKLTDVIDGRSYFSGSVVLADCDTECRLTLTVIIYNRQILMPDTEVNIVSDIVPVWWEFHTCRPDGEEPNDFSFSSLKPRMIAP